MELPKVDSQPRAGRLETQAASARERKAAGGRDEGSTPGGLLASLSAKARRPARRHRPHAFHSRLQRPAVDVEVILPLVNEEQRLRPALEELTSFLEDRPYSSSIVVVDCGSADRTADIAAAWSSDRVPVHLMGCSRRGLGVAIQRAAFTSRARVIGFSDISLTGSISALDEAVLRLDEGSAVVFGTRQPAASRLRGLTWSDPHPLLGVVRQLVRGAPWALSDPLCGFKFFRLPVAQDLLAGITSRGRNLDIQLIALCQLRGHSIVEVPLPTRTRVLTLPANPGNAVAQAGARVA